MKWLFAISFFVSTVFGFQKPYGSVSVVGNTPYVVISKLEIISGVFKHIALTGINNGDQSESIMIDSSNPIKIGRITVSSRTMGGSTITAYPIISSVEGFKNSLGFWPGKEIVWEGLSEGENQRLYLSIDSIYLYQEEKLDLILVQCDPISEQEKKLIQSSRGNGLVCLGNFRKEYSKYQDPVSNVIPQIVIDKFSEIEFQYITEEDKTKPYWDYSSDLRTLGWRSGPRTTPYYVGVFSAGNGKAGSGLVLVLLDSDGEIQELKRGYTRLIGVCDIDRDLNSEVLVFWGSGFGGGVEAFEIKISAGGGLKLSSLSRTQTVFD